MYVEISVDIEVTLIYNYEWYVIYNNDLHLEILTHGLNPSKSNTVWSKMI